MAWADQDRSDRGGSRVLLVLILLLALGGPPALAAELRGEVVGIADGDTLTLLTPGRRPLRIRLAAIDAPERRQPYGTRARQVLADLAYRRRVRVVVLDRDRYGRVVGQVHAGPREVNAEMLRRGAAWVYQAYSADPRLRALEAEARAARRGLWRLPEVERLPPWEWRRRAQLERRGGPAPSFRRVPLAVTAAPQ